MATEPTRTMLVNCPACRATTKVSGIPESKQSIHCPKCKQVIAIVDAKPVKDRSETGSRPAPLKEPTAEDYKRTYKNARPSKRRSHLFFGVIAGAAVTLIISSLAMWMLMNKQGESLRESPHLQTLNQLITLYRDANEKMALLQLAPEITDFNNKHIATANQIFELQNKYSSLPAYSPSDRDQVLALERELTLIRDKYDQARQRLAKLLEDGETQKNDSPAQIATRPEIASPSSTSSFSTTPDTTGSQPAPTSPLASAPTATAPVLNEEVEKLKVTITLLNLPKEQVTREFLTRLQTLAGGTAQILHREWSGDLYLVEIGPVRDMDRFAARINFGQVTRLDKGQRTMTVLVKSDLGASGTEGGTAEFTTDPVIQAISDLKVGTLERKRVAVQTLMTAPVDDNQPEAVKALIGAIAEKDVLIRVTAMKALTRWGGSEQCDLFITLLNEESPLIRHTALDQLSALKEPKAAEAVAKEGLLKDRDRASAALQAMGSVAEPYVIPYLTHADAALRIEACRILRKIGTRASIPTLLKITEEPKSAVTDAAWDAIESIAGRRG